MNKEKKKYTVTIFGDQYTLVSDEAQEHIMRVASLVDSLMQGIAETSKVSDTKKIAVLASLQMAEKLLSLETGAEKKERRQQALVNRIDKVLLSISSV